MSIKVPDTLVSITMDAYCHKNIDALVEIVQKLEPLANPVEVKEQIVDILKERQVGGKLALILGGTTTPIKDWII